MKVAMNNIKILTALLRNDERITARVKNSRCAAASIIASSRSTTMGLIPHEMLREAATPNATLIAQNCPPAQPVEGYKHPSREAA